MIERTELAVFTVLVAGLVAWLAPTSDTGQKAPELRQNSTTIPVSFVDEVACRSRAIAHLEERVRYHMWKHQSLKTWTPIVDVHHDYGFQYLYPICYSFVTEWQEKHPTQYNWPVVLFKLSTKRKGLSAMHRDPIPELDMLVFLFHDQTTVSNETMNVYASIAAGWRLKDEDNGTTIWILP